MAKAKKTTTGTPTTTEPTASDAKHGAGDGKQAALQRVIAQIEKQYGQGSIMQMDENSYAKIEGIGTGALSLDIALGGCGIPRAGHRAVRAGVVRQDDAGAARHCQRPEGRRRGGVHRR